MNPNGKFYKMMSKIIKTSIRDKIRYEKDKIDEQHQEYNKCEKYKPRLNGQFYGPTNINSLQ